MGFGPGDAYANEFMVWSNDSSSDVVPDALPTATAARNGVDDPLFVLTVAGVATGRYSVLGTIPITYQAGDSINVTASWIVDGVPYSWVIDAFRLDTVGGSFSSSDSILTIIQTAVDGPQEVSSDAGTVRQFALTELIAAHKYLQSSQADVGGKAGRGMRFTSLIPDGTVHTHGHRGSWRCR